MKSEVGRGHCVLGFVWEDKKMGVVSDTVEVLVVRRFEDAKILIADRSRFCSRLVQNEDL